MQSCIEQKVKSAILVSTDKAVRPTNIMGATKRFAESYSISSRKLSKYQTFYGSFWKCYKLIWICNPTFRKQISNGTPLTVTPMM